MDTDELGRFLRTRREALQPEDVGLPGRSLRAQHVSPGLMRVLDRLQDTPAQIMGAVGETLAQTGPAVALFGDETRHTGPARSVVHRWFTDPGARRLYPVEDHPHHSRVQVAQLRTAVAQQGPQSPAAELARTLTGLSEEFAELWNGRQVGLRFTEQKRFIHPEVGRIDLHCQVLLDPDRTHSLLVLTATPGSESHDKLALLAVLGAQALTAR